MSFYSPYAQVNSLKKSSLCSLYLQNETQATKKKHTHTHTSDKTTKIRNIKLKYPIIILNIQLWANQYLRHSLGYKQKIQVIRRNQVYFSSSNISTDPTVIVKD